MNKNNNWKRNTILFLSGQSISLFGSSLVQYAIMWYITLNTKSGVMMTLSIISGFLPTFFLSPFAGVWADRYNRKRLIILSDSAIAITTLIAAVLFSFGFDSIWMLFVVSSIRALGQGVQTPAISAMLPQLVPEDKLTKVNGMNGSIQSLIMLVSPMISAALLTKTSVNLIFYIDVVTALIAVMIILFFLQVPTHEKALQKHNTSYLADFKEGVSYIRNHQFVRSFFLYCSVFYVLVGPVAFLTPLQVTRSFGDDVWRLSAIEITFSVGMMAGGFIMAFWGGFKNKVYTFILASILMGVYTVALGVIPNFWIYLFFMALFGLAMPFLNTPATVLLQEKVEEDYLGRVFGVMGMLQSSMMPLGMLIFGPLSDTVSIEIILLITGLIMFVLGLSLLRAKELIAAGKPVKQESTIN